MLSILTILLNKQAKIINLFTYFQAKNKAVYTNQLTLGELIQYVNDLVKATFCFQKSIIYVY